VGSKANGTFATATGTSSTANGASASAYGQGSFANGSTASAFGQGSLANGAGATAIGQASVAGAGSTAIGQGAQATFANSIAIGAGATTTAANQVALGTATNTYRLAGLTSTASLAAQSGPISLVTTDAAGHLATVSLGSMMTDLSGLQSSIGSLQSSIGTLQTQVKQAFEGTAIAIATAGVQLPSDKTFAISANYGYFRGENAVSLGAALRLTDWAVASFAVGGGVQQHGYGGRAGLTLAW
jgi:hypothetical protein